MPNRKPIDTKAIEAKLDHVFEDPALLQAALTHPSMTGTKAVASHKKGESSPYERLEFLGDRVLGLVIAHWLYELYPNADEGDMAKRHAHLVNRDCLRRKALTIGLEAHLRLARGEDPVSERKNLAALSDAMEGLIGALYLDGGYEVVERFIKRLWGNAIRVEVTPADPKTALQEYAQSKGLPLPIYKIVERSGPSHAPQFKIQVSVKGFDPAAAEGGSKREAEKKAASLLLEQIGKAVS